MTLSLVRPALTALALCVLTAALPADVIRQEGALVGSTFTHTVKTGDTWASLGARFGVVPATLAGQNSLPLSARLAAGQMIAVDNRHVIPDLAGRTLTLNIAQRIIVFADADRVHAYPIGVGKPDWPTPVGAFEVVDLEVNPAWDVPISIQEEMRRQGKPVLTRVAPGPGNPLGSRFIRLSFFNVGIHGTSEPSSVYRYASHGCIRMYPGDIEELFPQITVGMKGASIYEPVLMTTADDRVFLEVHPDVYRRGISPMTRARALAERQGVTERVDWTRVEVTVRNHTGIAVDVTGNR